MSYLPENYDDLNLVQQRSAISTATGIRWDDWLNLPVQRRVELFESIQRPEWEEGLSTRPADIVGFWSDRLPGALSEMSQAAQVVSVSVAVVAVVYLFVYVGKWFRK